jgi:DnaJ-class molecular chaperone
MRWVLPFVVVFIGCVATLPDDAGVSADLACETARMVVQMRQEIRPTPTPDAGKCERCDGTGVLGDRASIKIKCHDCDGTGKKPSSVCKDCPK